MVDVTITLIPAGNTTGREIAALQTEVQDALGRVRGVQSVAPVRDTAPEGAKGVADVIGAIFLMLPPGVITGVFDVLKGILTRPAQPLTEVEVTAAGVKLKFDPKTVSLDEMEAFVKKLQPVAGAA